MITQKEKAEAFDKLLEQSKQVPTLSNACSVCIGYYEAANKPELVAVFMELRSKARSW